MATTFEIVVGTYEEFLLGYRIRPSRSNTRKYDMYQSFSTHSHTSSIRCLASNGKYVASGGCDDRICVFDLEARREIEDLYIHDGTVNSIQFVPDCSYLISCGADGKMAFTKTNTWKVDKVFEKAHKGSPVNYVSVHSSGKLALSIGNDMILRTWNLINGRQAFATSLKNKAFGNTIEFVAWSISGEYFLIAGKDIVEVWSTEKAEVISTKKCEAEPTSICWITDTDILVGMENGKLLFYNWEDENEEATMCEIYNNRVKAMKYYDGYLTTASSSGELNLWKVIVDEKVEIEMVCGIDIGCRLTCLDVIDLAKIGIIKEVKEEDGEDVPLKKSDVKKFKTKGTVVVEIDNDDDDDITVTPKPSKKRQLDRSSAKKKQNTPASNKKRKSVMLNNGFTEEDC
ncbi:p21-activated protein kinase-interacting protein 1-like [Chironomus tepperi]|uniref:p21-activated protein kinase-interacting protein 1-like n=1 Tax=Chironomus tepperi TaxID=113505 RepID=UPI00391F7B6B